VANIREGADVALTSYRSGLTAAGTLSAMSRLVDLSHTIEAGMTTYPGLPGPVISEHLGRADSRAHYSEGTEFHIGRVELVANTGTYLDTPFHRYEDGYDVADLDLTRCADLDGVCITVSSHAIEPSVFRSLDLQGKAVLFHTGWDRRWRTDEYGSGDHPYLTEVAAHALVGAGAALVGIDSVNIDDTRGADRPAHTILLAAGIPIVEHLTRLEDVADSSFRFFAVPPPFAALGTFPVRAFALV
jgi:arylformamidase